MRKLLAISILFSALGLSYGVRAQDATAAGDALDEPAAGGAEASAEATPATAEPTPAPAPASSSSSGAPKPISVGLLLGYGISFEDPPNPWGLGFGVRGGYNLDKLYLGARFVYYIGETKKSASSGGGTAEVSFNMWELGIEGGYDLDLAQHLILRPELGLGLANLMADVKIPFALGGTASVSSGKFYFAPGATMLYDVTDSIFLGVDVRLMVILSASSATGGGTSTAKGLILLANGGMRF